MFAKWGINSVRNYQVNYFDGIFPVPFQRASPGFRKIFRANTIASSGWMFEITHLDDPIR